MAFVAGLRPYEFDSLTPQRVWVFIDAYQDREKTEWERTRVICFNVAKFGTSDQKKFPRQIEKFWPFPWDKKSLSNAAEIFAQHQRMVEKRKRLENKIKNGS